VGKSWTKSAEAEERVVESRERKPGGAALGLGAKKTEGRVSQGSTVQGGKRRDPAQ